MSKPKKDINAWATMPMTKSDPLARKPVKVNGAESGYDVLRVIQESQQMQAADTIRTMAAHFMSQVPNMDAMTLKERDDMMTNFLGKLKGMMEHDTADFRHFVESYVRDLSKDAVAEENKISNSQLHQMGAMSTKGKLLQSAGMRIASNIHKLDPSRKQLGIYDSSLFEKPQTNSNNFLGKAYEKTKGFRDLFKEKESEEDKKVPEFDKKRFAEDANYHKKMLEYTKDIQKEAKEGNILTKKQEKLLKDQLKNEKLKHFIENPEDRMTDGGRLFYAGMKGIGSAGKGLFNVARNSFNRSVEDKAVDAIQSSPEAVKTSSDGTSKPLIQKMSREKMSELSGDKYKFNPDTNRWHDLASNKMVKASTVEGYAKEQQSNEVEKQDEEEEKLVKLLEKIEHNTNPDNAEEKSDKEDKGILGLAGDVIGGLVKLGIIIPSAIAALVAFGTYKLAMGANSERDENSTSSTVEQTDENGKNIGDDEDRPFHYEKGKLVYDTVPDTPEKSNTIPAKRKQIEFIDSDESKKEIPRKDIYEGRKHLIDLSENVKKDNSEKLAAADNKIESAKEAKESAKLVSNVTNAPSTTNIISGGGGGHFRQNTFNPDSSFNSWQKSRQSFV